MLALVAQGTKKLAARLVVTTATAEDVSAPSKEGEKAGDTGVLPSAVAPVVPKVCTAGFSLTNAVIIPS